MNKVPFSKLAHQRHADFLDDMEVMADDAYSFVIGLLTKDLLGLLKTKKLSKSDDELKRGWTGEVAKIEVDFDEILNRTLTKYLDALKYILLGKTAGVKAKNAAEAIGLDKKIIPGILQGAYLDSLDTHRKHFKDVTGEEPRAMPKALVKESMAMIDKKTTRFIDESLLRLRNRVVSAVEGEAQRVNNENVAQVHEEAHESGLKGAIKNVEDQMTGKVIAESVKMATDGYRTDWNRMVKVDLSLASAVGTHQVVTEIYGADDDDVKVAWVAMRDEKTCEFCKHASRDANGTFKLYRIGDFEPAGFNYGRKRADWRLCIPGAHPNCRCTLVYVPKGFEISRSGDVTPAVRGQS